MTALGDDLVDLLRHLPGLHDQKDHGKWAAKKAAKAAGDAPLPKAKSAKATKAAAKRPSKRPRATAAPRSDRESAEALRKSWEFGVVDNEQLSGGITATVDLVKLADGTKGVVKAYPGGKARDADAEELAADLANVLGVSAPPVVRLDDTGVLMGYVARAKTGLEIDPAEVPAIAATDAGKRMGLMDLLMENIDRHEGNWMVTTGGDLVAIDHGYGWEVNDLMFDSAPGTRPAVVAAAASQPPDLSVFTDAFVERGNKRRFVDNDLTQADIAHVRAGLESMRARFEELGHEEWLEFSLARLNVLGQHAKGTRNLVAA